MKISLEWLEKEKACTSGIDWFKGQDETNGIKLVKKLALTNFNWANWLLVRLMNHSQKTKYAIFSGEQVLNIFEKEYPKDKRLRLAIKAAKNYLKNPTNKNRDNVAFAVNAADAAVYAAANTDIKDKIISYGLKLLKKPVSSEPLEAGR